MSVYLRQSGAGSGGGLWFIRSFFIAWYWFLITRDLEFLAVNVLR